MRVRVVWPAYAHEEKEAVEAGGGVVVDMGGARGGVEGGGGCGGGRGPGA